MITEAADRVVHADRGWRIGVVYARAFHWAFILLLTLVVKFGFEEASAGFLERNGLPDIAGLSIGFAVLLVCLGYICRYLFLSTWPIITRVRDAVASGHDLEGEFAPRADVAVALFGLRRRDALVSLCFLCTEAYLCFALASATSNRLATLFLLMLLPIVDWGLYCAVAVVGLLRRWLARLVWPLLALSWVRNQISRLFARARAIFRKETAGIEERLQKIDAITKARDQAVATWARQVVAEASDWWKVWRQMYLLANLRDCGLPAIAALLYYFYEASAADRRLSWQLWQALKAQRSLEQLRAGLEATSLEAVLVGILVGGTLANVWNWYGLKAQLRLAYRIFFEAVGRDDGPPVKEVEPELRARLEEVAGGDEARLRALLERERSGEPLEYLVGRATFFGRSFVVDQRCYVPNRETEGLVDLAIRELSALAVQNPLVIDVGTGCGSLAISLKLEIPDAEVWGVDALGPSLAVARVNAESLSATVSWFEGDLVQDLKCREPDLIVADLPYGSPDYLLASNSVVRHRHMPRLATFGSALLGHYERLLAQMRRRAWRSLIAIEVGVIPEDIVLRELSASLGGARRCEYVKVNDGYAVLVAQL